jgi:hypothetical protein
LVVVWLVLCFEGVEGESVGGRRVAGEAQRGTGGGGSPPSSTHLADAERLELDAILGLAERELVELVRLAVLWVVVVVVVVVVEGGGEGGLSSTAHRCASRHARARARTASAASAATAAALASRRLPFSPPRRARA